MNITNLPTGGANVRVYKTTANGSVFLSGPATALHLAQTVITVMLLLLIEQLNSNSQVEM
jgi:hypothetical protein